MTAIKVPEGIPQIGTEIYLVDRSDEEYTEDSIEHKIIENKKKHTQKCEEHKYGNIALSGGYY